MKVLCPNRPCQHTGETGHVDLHYCMSKSAANQPTSACAMLHLLLGTIVGLNAQGRVGQ